MTGHAQPAWETPRLTPWLARLLDLGGTLGGAAGVGGGEALGRQVEFALVIGPARGWPSCRTWDATSVVEPCLGTVMVFGPGGCGGGGGRRQILPGSCPKRGNPLCLKGSKCPQLLGMTDNAHPCISLSRAAEARLGLNKKKCSNKGRGPPHQLVLLLGALFVVTLFGQTPSDLPPSLLPTNTTEPRARHGTPLDYIIRPPLMKSRPSPARPSSPISP